MDYLDKLFSQHVFIYKISGKYYAFGIRVCAECKMNIPALELRYNRYCKAFNESVSQHEANDIFKKLKFIAEFVRDKAGECEKPKEEIKEFNFNDLEMKELKNQVEKYAEFWKNINYMSFHRHKCIFEY